MPVTFAEHSSKEYCHASRIVCASARDVTELRGPSSLRHTCLTRWAESGMNPYELMRRAGNADLETTMRYIHMTAPKLRDQEVRGTTKNPHRASQLHAITGRSEDRH